MTCVKICGLTRRSDVELAILLGASYLGFILTEQSKRFVTEEQLKLLVKDLPKGVKKVGVFMNQSADFINHIASNYLDIVQLHGDETPTFQHTIQKTCWKALHANSPFINDYQVAAFLVDNPQGGSGKTANWQFAKTLSTQHPIILAGGLSEKNVLQAIEFVQPMGIDLSSALEEKPGIKSHLKMKSFFNLLKGHI